MDLSQQQKTEKNMTENNKIISKGNVRDTYSAFQNNFETSLSSYFVLSLSFHWIIQFLNYSYPFILNSIFYLIFHYKGIIFISITNFSTFFNLPY